MTKTEFQREERYVVFKVSDLGNSLKGDEIRRLAREYAEQRRLKGKEPLECVVVEKDWPEYEPTWRAIEARVTGAQPAPSVPDGWETDLLIVEHAMRMNNWDWNSDTSDDLKRSAYKIISELLAAQEDKS